MSLTTSAICLSTYLGIPIDVTNAIVQYATPNETKWIPQSNSNGEFTKKINFSAYFNLLNMFAVRPNVLLGVRTHTLVLDNNLHYTATTYVQSARELENGRIEITLYATVEVSTNLYDYYTIVYNQNNIDTRVTFSNGTMHGFAGELRPILNFSTQGNVIFVDIFGYAENDIDWTF